MQLNDINDFDNICVEIRSINTSTFNRLLSIKKG